MRSSRYNYIVNDGDSFIFFNGISESFFRVDPTRKNIYQEILILYSGCWNIQEE